MKKNRWTIIGILSFIAIAVFAFFWANAQMDALETYRSLLHDNPPEPGSPLDWQEDERLTQRVVFILVDALRNDTAHKSDVMPHLNELREQGAWATSHSQPPSYSAPGYSVLFTGAWPHLSDGPAFNLPYEDIPTWTQDNLFSTVHRAGFKTAVSGYYWFEKLIPQSDVDASFYTPNEDDAADRAVVDAALPWLDSGEYEFILIHLDQVDYAGHYEGGPQDPRWDEAAARVDGYIEEIVSRVDLETATVIITSDHGQIDRGGHGGHEKVVLTEPLILVGAGINPGEYPDTKMVDIAPTIAALLGTNIPATNQGHVLFDILMLSSEQKATAGKALESQQRQLYTAYAEAIGDPLPIREDMEIVTGTQFAIDAMLLQQRDKERRLRFNLPVALALIPAYLIFRSWNKRNAWLFGGAVAYLLLFHVRYAILDGYTYSFSSLVSAEDLLQFNAQTATLLLGGIWLFLVLKRNMLKQGVAQAAESTVLLTAFTLYLLSLPVLWHYGLNGFLTTWALPDFKTFYIGFLALVQILMVSIMGLVLTGIAALAARITKILPNEKKGSQKEQ